MKDLLTRFDAVVDKIPKNNLLTPRASIVHCTLFESAVIKFQSGNIMAQLKNTSMYNMIFYITGL